jgi:NAD(P)-dependent dehydrogenase (short-subunit alcohol dehydrogenase family)
MTLPLAGDLARHSIRVVSIAPGIFDSPMVANMSERTRRIVTASAVYPRRLGRGNEFARTVRWIIECPYVNGECIRISAGARMSAVL